MRHNLHYVLAEHVRTRNVDSILISFSMHSNIRKYREINFMLSRVSLEWARDSCGAGGRGWAELPIFENVLFLPLEPQRFGFNNFYCLWVPTQRVIISHGSDSGLMIGRLYISMGVTFSLCPVHYRFRQMMMLKKRCNNLGSSKSFFSAYWWREHGPQVP